MRDERTGPTGPTASGVLKKMDQPEFLVVLYMLKFMLPHLSTLSKSFQSRELNFSCTLHCKSTLPHQISYKKLTASDQVKEGFGIPPCSL